MEEKFRYYQRTQLQREADTYNHLPPHPRLARIFECTNDGDDTTITMEYLPKGTLTMYLRAKDADTTTELRARWAIQTAQGVAMLHAHGVIHADLKPTNMVLGEDLNLRIIDFAGCSLQGRGPYILESGAFYLPADQREGGERLACSTSSDVFALGSCVFQIATGRMPYEEFEVEDVEDKFAKGEFPGLGGVLFAEVIRRCWVCEFESAEAVVQALSAEARDVLGDPEFPSMALG